MIKSKFFNKRGTDIIEYTIILAFSACIGTSFMSDNCLGSSVSSIIDKVIYVLGGTKFRSVRW